MRTVAEHLVGGVAAFRLSAALQMPRDALAVAAAELIRSARGRRAVTLVRPVRAVQVPVALPSDIKKSNSSSFQSADKQLTKYGSKKHHRRIVTLCPCSGSFCFAYQPDNSAMINERSRSNEKRVVRF